MTGPGIQRSTRQLRFFLGIVVAFSGSLFFLIDGVCLAGTGKS